MKKDTKQPKKNTLIISAIITVVSLIFVGFILDKSFASLAVNCEEISDASCECLKTKLSKNVPFLDKISFLVMGASPEELASYISIMDAVDCAVRDEGFIDSLGDIPDFDDFDDFDY